MRTGAGVAASTKRGSLTLTRDDPAGISDVTRHLAKLFMSRYLGVRSPTAAQLDFLMASETEVLYAGTTTSGKSTAVLMAALVNAELPGYSAVIVVPELANSALVAMAREWLGQKDARWDAGTRRWRFPSGASLSIAHRRASISGGYQFIGVDDVARLEREEYLRLLARLHPSEALLVPAVLRVAGSPDEPGREWIAHRFKLGSGPDDAVAQGRRIVRASFKDEGLNVDADRVRQGLSELPEPQRTWLLLGDWGVQTVRAEADPKLQSRPSAAPGTVDDVERPRARLGFGELDGEAVWFDPYQPGLELPNPHVLMSGETGSGKTQSLQSVAAQLAERAVLPLVLDFKSDYDDQCAGDLRLRVIDPAGGDKLPFKPVAHLRTRGRGRPRHRGGTDVVYGRRDELPGSRGGRSAGGWVAGFGRRGLHSLTWQRGGRKVWISISRVSGRPRPVPS